MPASVSQSRSPRAALEIASVASPANLGVVNTAGADWASPTNAQADDGLYASATITSGGGFVSSYITLLQFGHALPEDAIIESIEVTARAFKTSGTVVSLSAILQSGGSDYGTSRGAAVSTTPAEYTLTWLMRDQATPLTVGAVNSPNFGVKVRGTLTGSSGNLSIDFVKIRINYYDPQNGTHWATSFDGASVTSALATNDGANALSAANTLYTNWPAGLTPGAVVNRLRLTDFDFAIPAGAVITGIRVRTAQESNRPAHVDALYLVQNGYSQTTDRSVSTDLVSTDAAPGAPIQTTGGDGDLWSGTWTAANFNDSDFGIDIGYVIDNNAGGNPVQVRLDFAEVTVYYYVPIAISATLAGDVNVVGTPELYHLKGLVGTVPLAISSNAPSLPMRYRLFNANLPLLTSIMASGLNGGIAYVDTDWVYPTRSRTEDRAGTGLWTNESLVGTGGISKWTSTGVTISDPFLVDTFNFGIPSNATLEMNTLKVRIRAETRAGVNFIYKIRLRKGDMNTGIEITPTVQLTDSPSNYSFDLPLPNDFIANAADINAAGWGFEFELLSFDPGAADVRIISASMEFIYHLPGVFRLSGGELGGAIVATSRLPVVNQFHGPRLSTQQQNENSSGIAWTGISTIGTNNGLFDCASGAMAPGQFTDYLNASAFGFVVPAIGELSGFSVTVHTKSSHSAGAGQLCDRQVFLLKQGMRAGTNKAYPGLALAGSDGAYGKTGNNDPRTYTWTRAELEALGITRAIVTSSTPLQFGVSFQLGTKSTATVNPNAVIDYIEATIFWTTLSGTLSFTETITPPYISNPVALQASTVALTLGATGNAGTRFAVQGTLGGSIEPTGLLTIPRVLSGTVGGTLSGGTPVLRLGLDHFLFGTASGQFAAGSPPLICDYRLFGSLFAGFVIPPAVFGVITSATERSFRRRILDALPVGWFGDDHPILDAVVDGLAEAWLHSFQLIRYAGFQLRLRTMTDGWIDLAAGDFFGSRFPRKANEEDGDYRNRVINEIFRERNTRNAIYRALVDLTGRTDHELIEPQRPLDTGVYGSKWADQTLSTQVDTGFLSFGQVLEARLVSDGSLTSWTNIGNALAADASSATATLDANGFTYLMRFQGIPQLINLEYLIHSITAKISTSATASSIKLHVYPVVNGVIGSRILLTDFIPASATEITVDLTSVLGLVSLRHPNSGIAIKAENTTGAGSKTINIESVTLQVVYHEADQHKTYGLGYGVAGIYGSALMDYQGFVRAKLPRRIGIANVGGYGIPVFGYGMGRGVWARSRDLVGPITEEDVYEAIDRVAPAGTTTWVNISA